MVTKLKEVDVVIVGLGWTGGILAKELTEAGLKVVALERGAQRTPENDYSLPNIRDELRYVVRHDLMQNTARDTITVRKQSAAGIAADAPARLVPARRSRWAVPPCIGAVIPGAGPTWNSRSAPITRSVTARNRFLKT